VSVDKALLCVYTALLCVYKALLYVYKALLCVYKALLCVYKALLCVYKALLVIGYAIQLEYTQFIEPIILTKEPYNFWQKSPIILILSLHGARSRVNIGLFSIFIGLFCASTYIVCA